MDLRIVIVEDDAHYRESLEMLLALEPGFALAASHAEAAALIAAVRAAPAASPLPWDIVLMDIDLPGITGIEATRAIKQHRPEATVVMLTAFEDPERLLAAIRAGADGYMLKRAGVAEVIEQLRAVAAGGSPLTPAVARSVLDLLRDGAVVQAPRGGPGTSGPRAELSPQERAVLRALVRGSSYKQVASDLGLSIDTVRTYIRRIYRKLQVHSATEAVARALRGHLAD